MPRRDDLKTIAIIGSGPIVIGQACEFDYSGVQALKVLREEGYRTVLINSNPATIMTDPDWADATYLEPLDLEGVTGVLRRERPDALLPTLGGQTALNLAMELEASGVLEELGIELIGASAKAIHTAEDREAFGEAMASVGLRVPRSVIVRTPEEAHAAISKASSSCRSRSARRSRSAATAAASRAPRRSSTRSSLRGLSESPISQVLVEESVEGWGEFELEVIRDKLDNVVIVCSIENLDPMGVHTGDSVCCAPAMTLSDREYQSLRDAAVKVIRAVGVETGGSNVQFGGQPRDRRDRRDRDEPARLALLRAGLEGHGLPDREGRDAARHRLHAGRDPERHHRHDARLVRADDRLRGRQGAALRVREVRRLGRDADDADEVGGRGDGHRPLLQRGLRQGDALARARPRPARGRRPRRCPPGTASTRCSAACARASRPDALSAESSVASRGSATSSRAASASRRTPPRAGSRGLDAEALRLLKHEGVSDARIARVCRCSEEAVRARRVELGVRPVFKTVDSCGGEVAAETSYLYSSYDRIDEPLADDRPAVLILGSGPNRIGQGIEFDYCCVQAVRSYRRQGYAAVMVNCNPETVSTDYDTADRLYFEPLTAEDVLEVVEREQPVGVVVQFGGQTPLKLARRLVELGVPILGTSPAAIDLAEDRERFGELLAELGLRAPDWAIAGDAEEAVAAAERIGYPVLVRPVLRARRPRDARLLLGRRRALGAGRAEHARRPLRRGRGRGRRRRRRRRRTTRSSRR